MADGWFFSAAANVVDPDVLALTPLVWQSLAPAEGQQFALLRDEGYVEESVAGFSVGVPATLSYLVTASNDDGAVGPEEYRVLINGVELASLTTTTQDAFVSKALAFTPTTSTVVIRFQALDPLANPTDPDELGEYEPDVLLLDKITVQQVPEPATWLMALCGAVGLACGMRAKRTSRAR
ncbi:MAG: hypothetical protein K2Y37_09470 [Pirellulales bacterium]|nr:hypothetical protein [Pirellulales bacterium]